MTICQYVVPFPRYSASKNGVTLKLEVGVVQDHCKWRRSIDHYDFLLVGHCKYCCRLYHFQVIWCWIIMTLKRSLKIIQTGSIWKLGCGFLFAFHSNYGRIFNRLWDIQRQRTLDNRVKGCWRSLKMVSFDRSHTTFYWSAIVNSSILYHFWVIWRWIISWTGNPGLRSLKVIQIGTIQKLGCGFLFAFHIGVDPVRVCRSRPSQ